MNIFEKAARGKFRFPAKNGLLTTEQLFDLELTHATKANLNDVAIALDDERDTLGRKSFVDTGANPRRAELDAMLDVVKFIIADKQAQMAKMAERRLKVEKRTKLLDARAAAEAREIGSKSIAEIDAELAALED